MWMVEIIVDFIKHGGNITNPRATYSCLIIVKIHFARNRNNFSTPNTYLVQKQKLDSNSKIAKLKHRKMHSTFALLCSQHKSVFKNKRIKHGRSSPVGFQPPPPPQWSLAFVGGWFEFKSGISGVFFLISPRSRR
jgi:hypothetical protein